MANKGKARVQDPGFILITAWCPRCWFRLESQFEPTRTEDVVRGFFKRQHATLPSGQPNSCTLAPRIPHYDNPRTGAELKPGRI